MLCVMESKQTNENLRHERSVKRGKSYFDCLVFSMESLENDQAVVASMPSVMESYAFPSDNIENGSETPAHELERRRNAREHVQSIDAIFGAEVTRSGKGNRGKAFIAELDLTQCNLIVCSIVSLM